MPRRVNSAMTAAATAPTGSATAAANAWPDRPAPDVGRSSPTSYSCRLWMAPHVRLDSSEAMPRFPQPGTVLLGKYRVDSLIGEGGMGAVVKAGHLDLDEQFAIKVLLPDM